MKRNRMLVPMLAALALVGTGCGNHGHDSDATGTFEATELTVSAEQTGRLTAFDVVEGSQLTAGQVVGRSTRPSSS